MRHHQRQSTSFNRQNLALLLDPYNNAGVSSASNPNYVRAHHICSRILNFLFVNFLEKKCFFRLIINVVLEFHDLFRFLHENEFRTDQNSPQISWK